ncbi:uncharacterized protein LOC126830031 [Patella vulgata]|uniref:uncharacterized protein LOC126830031 n=1 Tax=Patella vulgata TaxID=6465 RepID=UPI00217F36B0|nr:uncharacterized protein LOC126830031 [Patella vulgata]XP_050416206.1 uncharacterized protein LOC126830031 [Patella vulgata]
MYSCKQLIITIQLVCVVKSVIFCGLQNEHNEEPGTTHNCARCSSCSPGEFIKTKCAISNDTVCEQCPPGTFSLEKNSVMCTECTSCDDILQFTIQTCTAVSNTTCSPCPENMFLRDGVCKNCSTCPPGTYALRTCSGESDTVCNECRPGSFTATQNLDRYCKACAICLKNRIYNRSCTSTTDNICGDCKPGYYANENTGNCEKCSYCYPDHPGYTVYVSACDHISDDPDYRCMPVRHPPPVEFVGTLNVERTSSVSVSSTVNTSSQTKSKKLTATQWKVIIALTSITIFIVICVVVYCTIKRKKGHTTWKLLNVILDKLRGNLDSHISRDMLLEANGRLGSIEGSAGNENVSSNEALNAVESVTVNSDDITGDNSDETIGGNSDETFGDNSDETIGFEKFELPEHVVTETHPYNVDELLLNSHSENAESNISVDKLDRIPCINEKPCRKAQKVDHQLIVNRTAEMTVPMYMRGVQI